MQLDRRQFLGAAIVLPFLDSLRTAVPPRVQPPLLDRGFARITRLADGIYATIADPGKGPQCLSNGGILVGRNAALLIEGHFQPAGAMMEIEGARLLTKRPIRAAIDTHFHLDHSFGNSGYARAGVPIIAHAQAPALMKDRYARLKGVDKTPVLHAIEQQIAHAPREIDKQHLESDLGAAKWMYDAIDEVDLAYPTELLAPADCPRHIDLGGLTAVVDIHPGHTPTDLVISVPDRHVAFVGDLLFNDSFPVTIDADMITWRGVLDRLAREPRSTRFVPGHGAVCGQETVRDLADLFDDLHRHATRMIEAGASVEEASARYEIPARFHAYGVFSWDWNVGAALRSYYRASGRS